MPAKPEKLSKPDAIAHWNSLSDDSQCPMVPIEAGRMGSTFDQDTIRITGSKAFIDWCLGQLKGLLEFEGETSRIDVMYTQTVERIKNAEGKLVAGELTGAWGCYVKAWSRGQGRGRPSGSKNKGPSKPRQPRMPKDDVAEKVYSTPEPTEKTTIKAGEPLYAIASSFLDEEGNVDPIWFEPIDHPVLPCSTYEDVHSCSTKIDDIKRGNKALKKEKFEIVEINISKKGKLAFTQV
jgi:hypothetical protein